MIRLRVAEKKVLVTYMKLLRFYERDETIPKPKQLSQRDHKSLKAVPFLCRRHSFTLLEWMEAQFYWWDVFFKAPVPLRCIGTNNREGRKDSIWRANSWRELVESGEYTGMPRGPVRVDPLSDELVGAGAKHLVSRFNRILSEEDPPTIKDLLLNLTPSNAYYLVSPQARKFNDQFIKEFESIKEQYIERYSADPFLKHLIP